MILFVTHPQAMSVHVRKKPRTLPACQPHLRCALCKER